ncbi:hypothetical protein HUT06_42230 [Actinomadura sp. NAK00032]|uniref:hypothetical protein n=1 Tax=Actinomadura sp. NAK00032 TaxID=2742128 RepID=UPI0015906558|nr:hypothetical protein [Actinomadura sp. NAK00032]QKW39836.1 hypothetical protein HUT06_42230 [Actinomadura sp. NAK00032]
MGAEPECPLEVGFGSDVELAVGDGGLADGLGSGFGPDGFVEHGVPSQDDGVGEGVDEAEVASEKPNTACNDRPVAFGASATARMLNGFADGADIVDAGSLSVAVLTRGFSPTSPKAQSSRLGPAPVQSSGWLVQARGLSAVRLRVAPRAMPPSAWTRTVYTRA